MGGPPLEPWEWTPEREFCAQLIAAGALNLNEIAAECGVVRDTVWQWKRVPAFRARVHEHLNRAPLQDGSEIRTTRSISAAV
jgi:hypothetical protein